MKNFENHMHNVGKLAVSSYWYKCRIKRHIYYNRKMNYCKIAIAILLVSTSLSSSYVNVRNLGQNTDGCIQYNLNKQCTKCGFRKILIYGKCIAVSNLCINWDLLSGKCHKCYEGCEVEQGNCKYIQPVHKPTKPVNYPAYPIQPLCKVQNSEGKCIQCLWRVVMIHGKCVAVSDLCRTWNKNTGQCTDCYQGYTLCDGVCSVSPQPGNSAPAPTPAPAPVYIPPPVQKPVPVYVPEKPLATNQLCNRWGADGKCIGCVLRAVLIDCECVAVSNQCKKWDQKTAKCTDCYEGYQLCDGACLLQKTKPSYHAPVSTPAPAPAPIRIPIPVQQNPLCQKYGADGCCEICAYKSVLKQGKCIKVNDLCKAWDGYSGKCTDCYDGYALSNGNCYISHNVPTKPYVPPQPYLPPVQTYPEYKGQLCNKWDEKGVCCGCSYRAVLIHDKCVAVSNDCKDWDKKTGKCTACYDGCQLYNGVCSISKHGYNRPPPPPPVSNPTPTQPHSLCLKQISKGKCVECAHRAVLIQYKCFAVNDYCKTWNEKTGKCQSCYEGYQVFNGQCVIQKYKKAGPHSISIPKYQPKYEPKYEPKSEWNYYEPGSKKSKSGVQLNYRQHIQLQYSQKGKHQHEYYEEDCQNNSSP